MECHWFVFRISRIDMEYQVVEITQYAAGEEGEEQAMSKATAARSGLGEGGTGRQGDTGTLGRGASQRTWGIINFAPTDGTAG